MSLISDRNHENRLKEFNINIKTIYSDGDNKYEKNSNGTKNEDLTRGIIVEKDYYVNNSFKKRLYGFDPRIEYAFIKGEQVGKTYDCPNCRMITKITESIERCPFCGSHFNLDYKNKDLGSKNTYDLVLHNNKYIIFTLLLDLFVSFAISFYYFHKVSRTFNMFDILKASGVALGIALVLFFIFYLVDAFIVLLPIRVKKDIINKSDRKVWEDLERRNIAYNTFYNNLHSELDKLYYVDNKCSIIDYDIIDYSNFKLAEDAGSLYLSTDVLMREVKYEKNRLFVQTKTKHLVFRRSTKPIKYTKDGEINVINCHNCGASIDVTSDKCKYCDTENNYNQEWYLYK